jgi:hypothetical protein
MRLLLDKINKYNQNGYKNFAGIRDFSQELLREAGILVFQDVFAGQQPEILYNFTVLIAVYTMLITKFIF